MSSFDPFSNFEFDPDNGGYRYDPSEPLRPLVGAFNGYCEEALDPNCIDPSESDIRKIAQIKRVLLAAVPDSEEKGLLIVNPYLNISASGNGYSAFTGYLKEFDEKREFGIPGSLVTQSTPPGFEREANRIEIVEGTVGIALVVPEWTDVADAASAVLADAEAFDSLERNATTARDVIFERANFTGSSIDMMPLASLSLLLTKAFDAAYRAGMSRASAGNLRCLMHFLHYDFDPASHLHSVRLRWSETEGVDRAAKTGSAALKLSPEIFNTFEEHYILEILRDTNKRIRASVKEIQKN